MAELRQYIPNPPFSGITTNTNNTLIGGYNVEDDKAGDMEVICWAVNPANKHAIRFHLRCSFVKTGGVLTMSSVETVRASFNVGATVSTATLTFVSSNAGVGIRANGIAATTVRWFGVVKLTILGQYGV